MAFEQGESTEIALNVTLSSRGAPSGHGAVAQLPTSVAVFVGFCLTLLGLFWLLASQNWDVQGLSRPWPFTLGSITTYLALSQTVTAFMHQYLGAIRPAMGASQPVVSGSLESLGELDGLGDVALLALLAMGGAIWVLVTYLAPVRVYLKTPVRGGRRWLLVSYYLALMLPIYWVYARAWYIEYGTVDERLSLAMLFALQFVQPLLWFL
jgi:hypothetical protein